VVTEFTVPTRAAGLGGIAPGPDGNLWFTENVVNKVGRVTTSGHFNEFSLPPCQGFLNSCYPQGIVAGPDGNLWVTSSSFDKFWRVTTSGVITEFPGTPAERIVVGPDGRFWTSPSRYEGITVGPDGNVWTTALHGLWVSEDHFSRIVRTTPQGVATEFPLPIEKSDAQGIASGSDGNVWFTEPTRIGRFNLRVPPAPCIADSTTLCLNNNRFKVQAAWSVPSQGTNGAGSGVRLTGDTGYFWFFNRDNVELVLKVLDGTALNGCYWVFYGALSNVQYTIAVTDTETGTVTPYANLAGMLASVADTSAFNRPVAGAESDSAFSAQAIEPRSTAVPKLAAATACTPDPTTLCLNQSRFQLTVDWEAPSRGTSGHGRAVSITGDTGYFWFFNSDNVELVIKVLDGQANNGHYWVFYGALSNVQYTITVTDTQTQAVKTYENPSGTLASVADTSAF
jgi:streptogramin lyase